jgi:hypothetical protein
MPNNNSNAEDVSTENTFNKATLEAYLASAKANDSKTTINDVLLVLCELFLKNSAHLKDLKQNQQLLLKNQEDIISRLTILEEQTTSPLYQLVAECSEDDEFGDDDEEPSATEG